MQGRRRVGEAVLEADLQDAADARPETARDELGHRRVAGEAHDAGPGIAAGVTGHDDGPDAGRHDLARDLRHGEHLDDEEVRILQAKLELRRVVVAVRILRHGDLVEEIAGRQQAAAQDVAHHADVIAVVAVGHDEEDPPLPGHGPAPQHLAAASGMR